MKKNIFMVMITNEKPPENIRGNRRALLELAKNRMSTVVPIIKDCIGEDGTIIKINSRTYTVIIETTKEKSEKLKTLKDVKRVIDDKLDMTIV